MNHPHFHIIGHTLCPYVQRVAILMSEHSIPYKRTNIELDNKPVWLKTFSPMGKVPVLIVNEKQAIHESNVICEYLDEISSSSLHPKERVKKAQHRAWIEFGTEILNDIAKIIYQDHHLSDYENSIQGIKFRLGIVEEALMDGPFFAGCTFHLLDVVYATIFRYFDVIFLGPDTTLESNFPKTHKWHKVLMDRQSVRDAVPNNYYDLLIGFIKARNSYLSHQLLG